MSISSEITRISNAKTAIAESIANKGVTVPSGTKIDGMATLIDSIQTGGGAPSLQSKSVTYTSNGTATITPDEGYDGLSSVVVTVNVSGGGGVENEGCIVQIKGTFNSGGSIAYAELKNGTITTTLQYFNNKLTLNDFISMNVLKNSLFVVCNTTTTFSTEGNVVSGITGKDGYFPFWVTGDCKINLS